MPSAAFYILKHRHVYIEYYGESRLVACQNKKSILCNTVDYRQQAGRRWPSDDDARESAATSGSPRRPRAQATKLPPGGRVAYGNVGARNLPTDVPTRENLER